MTVWVMADIPSFIFDVLEEELYQIQLQLLQRVCETYNLDVKDAQARLLPSKPQLQIIPKSHKIVEVVQRKPTRPPADEENRCQARVWNRGRGGQCTRNKKDGGELCAQHSKHLRHGLIYETPPNDIFSTRRALYK